MDNARPTIADAESHLRRLARCAINAGDPGAAVLAHWPAELANAAPGSVRLLAVGKASLEMAAAAVTRLGTALASGVVTAVPERLARTTLDNRIVVYPADHPLPTERNVAGARAVRQFVELCSPTETLLVLISGGGSAHLSLPAGGLSLDDLRAVNRALQQAGCDIRDLNTVRRHTEQLKGGRLAALCRARAIHALILSDVMGDDLSAIASGPTAWDPTTYADALDVLRRWNCQAASPAAAKHLADGAAGLHPETPKQGEPRFNTVWNRVIASNQTVLRAVADEARRLGYAAEVSPIGLGGDAQDASRSFVAMARRAARRQPRADAADPIALVAGGEPTVPVRDAQGPPGRGGPSQEFALTACCDLETSPHIALLALATDGIDGNSDAAGALILPGAYHVARAGGTYPQDYLRRHDATPCLGAMGATIRTGPTGTNLNHVFVALVYPESEPR